MESVGPCVRTLLWISSEFEENGNQHRVAERNESLASVNEADRQEFNSLRPGQSAFFSVLKEHLSDARKIYINFKYQWEYENLEPIHRVEFASDKLPKDAR